MVFSELIVIFVKLNSMILNTLVIPKSKIYEKNSDF